MSNKMISKGDNSPNTNVGGDYNTAERDINTYNIVTGINPAQTIAKSIFADIIDCLVEQYVVSMHISLNVDEKTLPVKQEIKMAYNLLVDYKERFLFIVDPSSYENLGDVLNGRENTNDINMVIISVIDEYKNCLSENHNSLPQSGKKYDIILKSLKVNLLNKVKHLNERTSIEYLEVAVDLIIYDAFVRCLILDVPTEEFVKEYGEE